MSILGVIGIFIVCIAIAFMVFKVTHTNGIKPSTRRLRIAVDMDEVIADAFTEHLRRYNEQTGANLTKEMVTRDGLYTSMTEESKELFRAIPLEEGFFANLEVMPGSQEALVQLSQHHDVFITSAAMEVPTSFEDKFKWLAKNFPFIPPSRIVFCGDKMIVNADVLIDDRSRHFKWFAGTGILFTAPHNARKNAPLRANNWDEVLEMLSNGRVKAVAAERGARTLSMNPAES
jgi:5'(3')-deoxyribonucleotidase